MTRDDALRQLAADFAAGAMTDEEYVRRDAELRAGPTRLRFWAPRRRQRAKRDREHVRRLAYSGPLPPQLAARFTPSQLAVLRIIGDAGICTASVAEIAKRAGVSPRMVQMTIRLAEADGLLQVRERPVRAGRNDTNVVTVVSPEWRQWLARAARGKVRGQLPRAPVQVALDAVDVVPEVARTLAEQLAQPERTAVQVRGSEIHLHQEPTALEVGVRGLDRPRGDQPDQASVLR